MKKSRIPLSLFFFITAAGIYAAPAETFRVHQLIPVTIQSGMDPVTIQAGVNDAVSINLPKDMTFIRGIELDVKIPREAAAWRDAIAYSLYGGIQPVPSVKNIDYTGSRLSVGTFPSRLSVTISIPLRKDSGIKESPYAVVVPVIPDISSKFVFFRMQLAMKGVPESVISSLFEITVKPILTDEGRLKLSITEPSPDVTNPYAVYLDDAPVTNTAAGLIMATGEHHVSIVSDSYRNEVRSFRIDQAKTTNLAIKLRDIAPTVRIIAPENTVVFFDGTQLDQFKDPFVIATGDHTVKFVMGDYEVVKALSARNGRSYTVSLSIDATISEDD